MTNKGAVLIFGAFNPFTNAHLNIGMLAHEEYPDYEICYIPARLSYMLGWKKMDEDSVIAEDLRYELIKGSIEGIPGFSVSDIEIKGIVNGKSYNTIKYFRDVLGYSKIVLCMGTDKVSELETWFMGKELIKENEFLIITRSGDSLEDKMTEYTGQYRNHFREVKNETLSMLSASTVRQKLSEGDWAYVKESVPPFVFNSLYGK